MKASLVRRTFTGGGRIGRITFALGVIAAATAVDVEVRAQALDSRASLAPAKAYSARRARTMQRDRPEPLSVRPRDYGAELVEETSLEGPSDIGDLQRRMLELSEQMRELNALLRRHEEAAPQVRARARPMRFTLLERHRPEPLLQTCDDAVKMLVRDRARVLASALDDRDRRKRLAIDPDRAEVTRLLDPVYEWLDAQGSPAETTRLHLQALVYVTLLEARVRLEPAEPLPALHKVLRAFRVDRASVAEHLRRTMSGYVPPGARDLGPLTAAAALMYPEEQSAREVLTRLASRIGAGLAEEVVKKGEDPYRADGEAQFAAASDNAVEDNRSVLELQIALQRMLLEIKSLRAAKGVDDRTVDTWQHRLLQAERELDNLLRSADSERDAVMTLARRWPLHRAPSTATEPAAEHTSEPLAEPGIDLPREEMTPDELATQH